MKTRTKTRKCGVFTLTAMLLVTAVLITSCLEPLVPGGLTRSPPPEGKGYLVLNVVNENNGRTILPTAPTITHYVVRATTTTGSPPTVVNATRVTAAGILSPGVTLPEGTYNIEVLGYTSATSTIVAAVGSSSGVVIANATPASATVVQHEIYSGADAGEGTFGWNFTLPGTPDIVDSATMTVKAWPGDTALDPPITGVDVTTAGSRALPAGYYYVDVTLVKTGHRSQVYREIVHIASGLTSTWTKTFSALDRNVYVVTFSDPESLITPPAAVSNITHGATITAPTPEPTSATHTFDGWARTSGDTDYWNFTTDQVLRDRTLYAAWTPNGPTGTLTVMVSFTMDHSEGSFTLSTNPVTFSQATLEGSLSKVVTVTLDNTETTTGDPATAPFIASSIKWMHGSTVMSTGAILTIDFADSANLALLVIGSFDITIEATPTGKTEPYSAVPALTIEITP